MNYLQLMDNSKFSTKEEKTELLNKIKDNNEEI